jgi:DNA-directed RNA polymerase subunit RPC12/RpoP
LLNNRCHKIGFSKQLYATELTFACPHCSHKLVKKGSWFARASGFKCAGCGRKVRISYEDKVRLFDGYVHLIIRRKNSG